MKGESHDLLVISGAIFSAYFFGEPFGGQRFFVSQRLLTPQRNKEPRRETLAYDMT